MNSILVFFNIFLLKVIFIYFSIYRNTKRVNKMLNQKVYEADEDSFLLFDTLKKELALYLANTGKSLEDIKLLEMGAGSGYIGFSIEDEGLKKVLLADINPSAIEFIDIEKKETGSKVEIVESDLFSNISEKGFDIIIFNTPYLPNDEMVHDIALHGGPSGNEVAIEFIKQAKDYLSKQGFILLLTSSLANPELIEEIVDKNNMLIIKIASKKLFFEELIIYKIVNK